MLGKKLHRITIRFDRKLYDRIVNRAKRNKETKSELIYRAIEKELKRKKPSEQVA